MDDEVEQLRARIVELEARLSADAAAPRERDRKLRLALDATKLGLWCWDLATGELLWNEQMKRLIGTDEPHGLSAYTALVHTEDREAVRRAGERTLELGRFEAVPHRITRPDGEVRWMITIGEVVTDECGRPVRLIGGNIDITEQRSLEDELGRSRSMNAVGGLAAGVAHNFNNMLTVVLPSLELLRGVTPRAHVSLVDNAATAARDAANLVRKLVRIAEARAVATQEAIEVGPVAEQVARACRETFDPHIDIVLTLDPEPLHVVASATDVEHVLMCLLLNSRDAVLDAGIPHPRIEVLVGHAPGSDHIRICVRDDGPGMTAETRERAFEPFFTTKAVGRGTGLGLAVSHAIVRDLGGSIAIESERRRGTTVEVLLPTRTRARDDASTGGR